MALEHNNWYQSLVTMDKWYQTIQTEVVLIEIVDGEDKYIKIEINQFDEKSNFFLWQVRMKNVLI